MRFGLLGFPIQYSLSPKIHALFAEQYHIKMTYQLMPTQPHELMARLNELVRDGYSGVNLTQPLKKKVLNYVSFQSARVQNAHAANTLSFLNGQDIYAENTDGIGFLRALTHHVSEPIEGKHVLILGAGGAAAGMIPELPSFGLSSLSVINRSIPAMRFLGEKNPHLLMYSEATKYDWIINTTTLPLLEVPMAFPQVIFQDKVIYDINYRHKTDELAYFVDRYQPRAFFDGLSMLVEQAAYAFSLWHQVQPDTKTVLQAIC